jgi:hypothetical protein
MKNTKYCQDGTLSEYALHCGYTCEFQGYTLSVRHGVFFAIPPAIDDGTQQIRPNFTARTKAKLLAKLKQAVPYEYTDTFGGEANYSWVKRGEVFLLPNASDLARVRAVKKALGLEGVPCKREEYGEQIVLRSVGSCTVVFIG